ncbi:MAG: GrpB family protein [Hyphomonadaceae bacterium]
MADMNAHMKRIVAYNPLWTKLFSVEAGCLSDRLGPILIGSHHIGSTAIPNLPAKPIIDILLEVETLSLLDAQDSTFASCGYDIRGAYGIEGRRYFNKRPTVEMPGFHVHAYKAGSYQVHRHLAFRNYLRLKPDIATEYADIKRSLSDSKGILTPDYQAAKKPWVDAMSLEALSHFSGEV